MNYSRLGNSGLKVSRICLGCMSFGSPNWLEWVKGEEEAIEIIKAAYDIGINFFDTADVYSNGESEIILGKALKQITAPRNRIMIATKFYAPVYHQGTIPDMRNMKADPNMVNRWVTSRKHIFDAVEASLKRLDVDYIDLYQVHQLDGETPLEETMEALNDLVRSGKIRYIGASLMKAWKFQKMNNIAERNGWTKFISMQNCYNLVHREDEREMIPYCLDSGIGGMIYSPLAGGVLAGRNRKTTCSDMGFNSVNRFPNMKQQNNEVIYNRVFEIAERRGVTDAQVSLAWLLLKPYTASVIVGIGNVKHLNYAVSSLLLELNEDEIKYLEEPYTARPESVTKY